jgi:amino acid permease
MTAQQLTETLTLLPTTGSSRTPSTGSSLTGCIFNFTNSIVGAGCIGLGGAIASSGGLISIVAILGFAILSKLSFDLLIDLSECCAAGTSYEHLASQTYGRLGLVAVSVSRFVYAYGCLVAYIKIVDDNFASAIEGMTGRSFNEHLLTFSLSATIILPLSLMRDMALLERVSFLKLVVVVCILATIISLYPANHRADGGTFQTHWIEVQPGVIQSLGTFVFTFVAQHVVHLTYASLKPEIRTASNWRFVSTLTMVIATTLSLAMALSVYVTFWEQASSNIFHLYPPSISLNTAKLLLSFMMMFTYPLPFLACRELAIISIPSSMSVGGETDKWWLLESKQLILPLHILVTVLLWSTSTVLALLVPSLGDVLNLVGCVSGTMIAFILPAMFSFRLKGYTHLAGLIFLVGGTVGTVGTIFNFQMILS